MKIKINSLVSLKVEQIKISGKISVAGREIPAGFNKTLDSSIVAQLPPELVGSLTASHFGGDYTAEEIAAIAEAMNAKPEDK